MTRRERRHRYIMFAIFYVWCGSMEYRWAREVIERRREVGKKESKKSQQKKRGGQERVI